MKGWTKNGQRTVSVPMADRDVGLAVSRAVSAILGDLRDRSGFRAVWESTDYATRTEIRAEWVRLARIEIEGTLNG